MAGTEWPLKEFTREVVDIMPTYQDRIQAIPAWLRGLLLVPPLVVGLLLGGYWWWSYTGLYQWLAEGQIYLMQSYYPGYTGILTLFLIVFACMIPSMLVLFILAQLELYPPPDAMALIVDKNKVRAAALDRWIRGHIWGLILLGLGVAGLIVGCVLYFTGATAGERTELRLSELEAGVIPSSRWVFVRGKLRWDLSIRSGALTYVPMVSERWQPGQTVGLFVRVRDEQKIDATAQALQGTLALSGLPGPVRAEFEKRGPAPMARYEVLELGNKPQNNLDAGGPIILSSLGILALTGLIWSVIYIRSQRRLPPPAPAE
jgi:hypothetical protein